jgi:hypothetical protein
MKRLFIVVLAAGIIVTRAEYALAQSNPRGVAKMTVGSESISVEYGRPSLKGRTLDDLLLQLKPPDAHSLYGDFWRLGADKSTTFSTTGDLQFEDVIIPKGQYSIWAVREADIFWDLVFNKQHGQWGTQHDASQDFASVPLTETEASNSAEMVTISLIKKGIHGGVIIIQWGDLKLATDFKTQ